MKSRIKNILTYRQPSPWITACTFVLITVILAVCIVNPKPEVSPVQQSYKGYNVEQLLKPHTLRGCCQQGWRNYRRLAGAGRFGGCGDGAPDGGSAVWLDY